jgi:hypothetical protein
LIGFGFTLRKDEMNKLLATVAVVAASVVALAGCNVPQPTTASTTPKPVASVSLAGTNGSGGPLTDRLNVAYTNPAGTASRGHIYAAGLDWNKPVGILVYGDGSGEYGLKNPSNTYLLAGTNGLVAVAKRNNLLLVTPQAPGGGCDDGDGVCWYDESGSTTIAQKIRWADDFIKTQVLTQYNIDTSRAVIAGYSSGAQFTSEYYGPQYAGSWMTDGLLMPISFGGSPKVPANFSAEFKANVAAVWDVGANDPAYRSYPGFDAQSGYNWYRNNGFPVTELNVVANKGHARGGEFGALVEREIKQHVGAGGTVTPPPTTDPTTPTEPAPAAWDHQIVARATGATITVDIPVPSPRVTWRMSKDPITTQTGFYEYTDTEGNDVVLSTTSTLLRNTTYYYQIESGTRSNVVARGTFKTLP